MVAAQVAVQTCNGTDFRFIAQFCNASHARGDLPRRMTRPTRPFKGLLGNAQVGILPLLTLTVTSGSVRAARSGPLRRQCVVQPTLNDQRTDHAEAELYSQDNTLGSFRKALLHVPLYTRRLPL